MADLLFYFTHPDFSCPGEVVKKADELGLISSIKARLDEKLRQVSVPPAMKTFLDWMQRSSTDPAHDYHQYDANPLELFLQEEFENEEFDN